MVQIFQFSMFWCHELIYMYNRYSLIEGILSVVYSKSTDLYELTRIHDIKSNPVEVGSSRFSSPRLSSPHSCGSAESFSSLKVSSHLGLLYLLP